MDLECKYGLFPSYRISTLENVGLFVFMISLGASNRDVQEKFQHSSETLSRFFKEVLDVMDGLSRDIIRPRDPEFKEIPSQIANDTKYIPYFKYPKRQCYLTPYHKIRYHPSEFRGANLRGLQEIFNRIHSSLRSCVERAFGILKAQVIDANPNFIPPKAFSDAKCISTQEVERMSTNEMTKVRNDFTTSSMAARQQRRVS
ncbi:hypothetical protein Gotur_000382 [Gossypium turneri]